MGDDDTEHMPPPDRIERYLLVGIALAYLVAGAVLGFACVVLLNTANQIQTANLCRRI